MEVGSVRKRRGTVSTACLRCHRRKQRCVGHPICGNCDAANVTCSRNSSTVARRLAGLSKEELLKRIESLEDQTADTAVTPVHAEAEEPTETQSRRPPPYYHDRHGHRSVDEPGRLRSNNPNSSSGQSADVFDIRQEDEERGTASQPRIHRNGVHLPPEPETVSENKSPGTASRIAVGTAASRRPILAAYLDNMHRRVPFCNYVDILMTNEGEMDIPASTHPGRMDLIRLYMACAIGARVKQLTGTVPPAAQAHEFLDRALALHSMSASEDAKEDVNLVEKAEFSLWLVLYKLRTSYIKEAWDLIGSAMRAAVAADLHRERHYRDHVGLSSSEAERHCLLFWAIYIIERNICWTMKRPFSLADCDIDARLPTPLSYPTSLQGADSISDASDSPSRPVDLKIFIATIGLARINSQVYVQASRADRGCVASDILPLLEQMREFEAALPHCSAPDYEFLQLHVNNAVRMLIEPFLFTPGSSEPLTRCCLDAAGAVCRLFKRLRLNRSIGFSITMVKSVFLAGMTICFIISKSTSFWTPGRANDLRACSSSLFAVAERNASARDYCETLDAIIDAVSEYVEQMPSTFTVTNNSNTSPNTNNSSPLSSLLSGQQTFEGGSMNSLADSAIRTPQAAFDRLRHEFMNAKTKFTSSAYPNFSLEPPDLNAMTPSTPATLVTRADGATSFGLDPAFQPSPFDLFSEGFDMGTLGFSDSDNRFQ